MADCDVTGLKTLPLDALHRELGGRMVPFAGYAMPVQYPSGVMAEHLWTRESAGLFDVSHMGQLTLEGEGAAQWLETIAPGDFLALAPGRMRYSLLLADDGGILDDLMVTSTGRYFYLVVNGATKQGDIAHMCARLPAGLVLTHLEHFALLALQGPKAVEVMLRLGVKPEGADIPTIEAMKFMTAGPYLWGDVRLGVSRSGYTGEDGYEISLPAGDARAFAEALLADPAVKPIGLGARDSLRLEAGLPLYGHDLTPEIEPVEAGLGFAVSKRRKAEGGFPGAERILKALADGPARKRVGLKLDGRQPAREGAELFSGGEKLGVVTSGGFAPSVGAPIAMGYVPAAFAAEGTALEIEVRGKRLGATVVPTPFHQKNYVR
ncbi:glycine cleavage system aminomethyltransferase GcvT [Sandaracinobacter sp. RS1-74]|uniref:glycine cleavage system aminomethyltransferase GcvT n=1 Tax=Sandaracinobacteroides sayramensis TaxID=2913411 RepID=UPI001EDAFEDC|nr:glycine cleavage system aminomethyltransferase GcvT [Sandaracinobacteroides sayramensis]MCG2842792.1 glycine cleavage system aminomethyltransferase GcvT [Sandaracinobacteroides sayramensis]